MERAPLAITRSEQVGHPDDELVPESPPPGSVPTRTPELDDRRASG